MGLDELLSCMNKQTSREPLWIVLGCAHLFVCPEMMTSLSYLFFLPLSLHYG